MQYTYKSIRESTFAKQTKLKRKRGEMEGERENERDRKTLRLMCNPKEALFGKLSADGARALGEKVHKRMKMIGALHFTLSGGKGKRESTKNNFDGNSK